MFQINELKKGDGGVGTWKGEGWQKLDGEKFGCRSGCLLSPEEDTRLCYPDSLTVVIS